MRESTMSEYGWGRSGLQLRWGRLCRLGKLALARLSVGNREARQAVPAQKLCAATLAHVHKKVSSFAGGGYAASENSLSLDFQLVTARRGGLVPAVKLCAATLAHVRIKAASLGAAMPPRNTRFRSTFFLVTAGRDRQCLHGSCARLRSRTFTKKLAASLGAAAPPGQKKRTGSYLRTPLKWVFGGFSRPDKVQLVIFSVVTFRQPRSNLPALVLLVHALKNHPIELFEIPLKQEQTPL